MSPASLDADEFARAFPYFLLLGPDLEIEAAGPALERHLQGRLRGALTGHFQVERPALPKPTFAALLERADAPVVLLHTASQLRLRGELLPKEGQRLLYLGTPWVRSLEEAHAVGLQVGSFPTHSAVGDYLLLLQTQRTSLGELQALASDLSQKQRDLRQALRAAEEANAAKSEFLASASHEIRTPLNAILGFGELLRDGVQDPRLRGYARSLVSAGEHLCALVDDLLDLAQIERGEVQLQQRPFELREAIGQAAGLLQAEAAGKGLELTVRIDPSLPAWVRGDPRRLRQVLVNLLSNGVKYTTAGSVTLEVAPTGGPAGELLEFVVADTGVGISLADRERIFERFVRLPSADGKQGVGLGLTVARSLCRLMGGELSLTSEVGVGSRFRFAIPLPGLVMDSPPSGLHPLRPERGLRLLVAEDNRENQLLLQEFLRDTPHSLCFADDGVAALDALRAQRFDLVLLDLQMPRMSGYEVAQAIRAQERAEGRPRTPVIALTAHAYPEFVRRSLEAGCDQHLSKPIRRDELLLALERTWSGTAAPRPGSTTPTACPPAAGGLEAAIGALAKAHPRLRARAQEYLNGQAERLGAMRSAWRAGRLAEVASLAHKLRGTAASYGFPALGALGAELEDLASAGTARDEQIGSLLTAMDASLAQAREAAETLAASETVQRP